MEIDVRAVAPDERSIALGMMFPDDSEQERALRVREILESARDGELNLDGLLMARDRQEPVGAAFWMVHTDGTAFVWPPVSCVNSAVDNDFVVDCLYRDICKRIDAAGAHLGQCLLEPERTIDRAALERNGFQHLADLTFMQKDLRDPLPALAPSAFQTVRYDRRKTHRRFLRVIEQTYLGTRDCPEFHGQRTAAQAVESHRSIGVFDPDLWRIYAVGNEDVGVLLFADHPDQRAWEVVYLGVVPEARGRGYGRMMLLKGFHEAQAAGRDSVTLAVDNANNYAIAIYRELGMFDLGVRSVHVRQGQRSN